MQTLYKIVCILIIGFALSGCINQRATRLARIGNAKIQKAMRMDPSIVNPTSRIDTITLMVPEVKDSTEFETESDTTAHETDIQNYDSLVVANQELINSISSGRLSVKQMELAMLEAKKNQNLMQRSRDNFLRGYQKDSTYIYEDRYIIGEITIQKGSLHDFKYTIKEQKIDTLVVVKEINVEGSRKQGLFYLIRNGIPYWGYGIIGLITVILVIVFVLKKIN